MSNLQQSILNINALNIWDHQKDAIKDILEYIESFNNTSFLIKMPTGTGKTGVFACLSRIGNPSLNYIIITPSTALKFQIIEELKTGFWKKIKKNIDELPDQFIESLLPSDVSEIIPKLNGENYILVTTIQALQAIASDTKYSKEIDYLKQTVNCLIFDEGHKEPAYTWGETVRSFNKPTILFSATPYRNDYKVFNINKEKFYSLEHSYCEQNNILRKLEIKQIRIDPHTPSTFVNELLNQIHLITPNLTAQGITNPKVIIRCENSVDIKNIVKALKLINKRVVGIHETFTIDKYHLKDVPNNVDQLKYDFFIHQYKLIEGIDNPDFCIVALYSSFRSTRLLIQQIGRILRNPLKQSNQIAYLFGIDITQLNNEWKKYLEYDKLIDSRKILFDVTDVLKVNKQASTLYFSGTFRDLVNVNNLSLSDSLMFQKKINVYSKNANLTFSELASRILDEWQKKDYVILKQGFVDTNTLLILYIKYENSPLVKDGIFIEQTLALTFLKLKNEHVFYYDSIQSSPMNQIEELTPVSRESLIKLFNNKKSINKIFLMNTDIGNRSVRNKELHAGAIEATAPGLADYSYFPARIEGEVRTAGKMNRRYIGFQNGRITDFTNKRIEYKEFVEWLDEVDIQLKQTISASGINGFLNRFSQKVDPPQNPIAGSILLDLEIEDLMQYKFGEDASQNEEVQIEDYCANITNDTFLLVINKKDFQFNIKYEAKLKRFIISCSELNEYVRNINKDESSLIQYLNSNQSFRIVVVGNEYVYAYKNFFKPGLNLISKNKDLDLNQIFSPHQCISNIASEKGDAVRNISNNLWHKETLFGLISRLGIGYNDTALENELDIEYLLCDDLSSEIADFIGLDTRNKRVIFIHAKAKEAQLSASSFQEICGQATKNLDYLTPYFEKQPDNNIKKWKKSWSLTPIGVVKNRVINGEVSPENFWKKYVTLISDPTTSREVHLFVGGMFNYNAFKKEINKSDIKNVKPEIIQLIYLLRSTWNSVSSVGAKLKVFC